MSVTLRSMGAKRSGGYALFEALIAVVVLSVGFIGATRLQAAGLKLNASAHSRQKATMLAYQMTDRIRANLAGVASNSYNNPVRSDGACLATGCTPLQLAEADMGEWLADVEAQLPLGTGVVCVDGSPDDGTSAVPACDNTGANLVVKVFWTDTVAQPDGSLAATRFVTVLRP